jgi:hypothetical protein
MKLKFLDGLGCVALLVLLVASPAQAQQNLFNAPSGTITPKGKIFYQHQINLYDYNYVASKQHFVYGLGRNFEVGVNLLNVSMRPFARQERFFDVNYRDTTTAFGPIVALTGQKLFKLNERLAASVGTQAGVNLGFNGYAPQFTHFSYGLLTFEPRHHLRLVAGAYYSDRRFIGPGNQTGFLFGYEIPINKRFYLMGDFISGRTESSVSVIGGFYNVTDQFQLCLGALVPNPGSPAGMGLVLEVNLFNF